MENEIKLQVGVKILLQNKDGKFLMLRRSLEKYPEVPNRWDIVGGRIEPGATLLENLKREIHHETGLELIGTPKLIAAQDILKNKGQHVVRLTYVGQAQGEIELDTSENVAYQWYTLKELQKLDDVNIYFKELLKDENLLLN